MSSIKINRAIALAKTGKNPGCALDMMAAIPANVVAHLPARLLAEMIDANWQLALASKAISTSGACDEGVIWDAANGRLRDIAA